MALSLESANLVRQKVRGFSRDAAAHLAVDAFFRWWSEHKGNNDLQFVAINNLGADVVVADAACQIYFIYLRKQNTGTDAYFKADDSATSAGTTASALVQALINANDDVVLSYPDGWDMANGFTVGSDTTADGSTASSSGDGPNGFVILGAA